MNKIIKKVKDHLIPHKDNNNSPHFFRNNTILFCFLLIIILELGLLFQVFFVFNKTKFLAAVLPGVLTSLTNDQREEYNLNPLKENELLKQAAQLKANDMASKGYFAHNSPDGKTPWYWFEEVNYKYKLAGENLAVNFFESEDVARAWMASPTHKANIVKEEYTEIGIAVANGKYKGKNAVFVVQLFGKPLSNDQADLFSIVNKVEANTELIQKDINKATVKIEKIIKEEVLTKENKEVVKENIEKLENKINEKGPIVLGEENEESLNIKNFFLKIKNDINELLLSPIFTINNLLYIILFLIGIIFIIFLFKTEIMHTHILIKSIFLIIIIIILLLVNIKLFNKDNLINDKIESFTSIKI